MFRKVTGQCLIDCQFFYNAFLTKTKHPLEMDFKKYHCFFKNDLA